MRIGVVAPARTVSRESSLRLAAFMALTYPEHDIVFHPQCYLEEGHFAGSDEVRAAAFLEFANDPGFDAIWFARGGYGSNRIFNLVMPKLGPAANNKTYIGFSDMGFILSALYQKRIGRQAHGSMASSLGRNDKGDAAGWVLGWLIDGDKRGLDPTLDGRPAIALNLSILVAMIGTPWLPDLTGHVLYLEEVGESYYRIDRTLWQMANAPQLKGLAGVRMGAVTDVPEDGGAGHFGATMEQMMTRWCGELGVPYLGGCEIGHIEMNKVVPFGKS